MEGHLLDMQWGCLEGEPPKSRPGHSKHQLRLPLQPRGLPVVPSELKTKKHQKNESDEELTSDSGVQLCQLSSDYAHLRLHSRKGDLRGFKGKL
jgi:hypothetical protein